MPSVIAFFPWVHIDEPLIVGRLRLLPYARGRLPGDGPKVAQKDIDAVLRAYAVRKNQVVQKATLLELGTWRLGQDASRRVDPLFTARELIAFSALAERQLFGQFSYCNFDTYALTIQRYHAGSAGAFSFFTRRRDGGTNQLWDTKEFTFLKPLHVEFDAKIKIDRSLVAALLKADNADKLPLEAIIEFNRANTDSQDVPSHTEVVMTKSALEFLFGIGEKRDELVRALNAVIPLRNPPWPNGPLRKKWQTKFPKAARPLEAWGREFCDLRGGAAHGQRRGGDRFIWSERAHLAFASILFPLLVKQRLAGDGFMELQERDAVHLELIEAYLMHNPFIARRRKRPPREHPWRRIYSERILGELMRRQLLRQVRELKFTT